MVDGMKAARRRLGSAFRWEALITHHTEYAVERAAHEDEREKFNDWFWPIGVVLYALEDITEAWATPHGLMVLAIGAWIGSAVAFKIRARRARRRLKDLAPSGCRCAWFEGYEPDPGPEGDHVRE